MFLSNARHPYLNNLVGNLKEVALAALYVSTKEHDTLKKPRELLSVSYAVRYPELAAKSKNPSGEIDLDTMDPTVRSPKSTIPRVFLPSIVRALIDGRE